MVINFNNFGDKEVKQKILQIFKIALKETNKKDNVSANITVVGRKKNKRNEQRIS